MRPWHAKLVLWELVGTRNYRALSHKYTFTHSDTQMQVYLRKQTSLCGKQTSPCNFHPPRNDQVKISCCQNLLHLERVTTFQARFCDDSSSCQNPNQKTQPLLFTILGPNSFCYSSLCFKLVQAPEEVQQGTGK